MKTLLWLSVLLASANATAVTTDPGWTRALDEYLYPAQPNAIRTDSVLVIEDGKVIYEKHREPKAKRHILWSISKSITSALIGIGVKDGKIRVEDSICKYFPELSGSPKCAMTVDHVLQWGSGLNWNEEYENAKNVLDSSVIQMLYGDGVRDVLGFVLKQPLESVPGKMWRYSSGDSVLLQGVLKKAYGDEYKELPRKRLFGPLGMNDTMWEADPSGTYGGASYVYASAWDLSRIGELYLNDGVWQGARILPEGWVKYSTSVADAFAQGERKDHKYPWVAGHHWWLNRVVPAFRAERSWPSAPEDTFVGIGHWGQNLVVIPSRKIVAVRLGDDRQHGFSTDEFLKRVLEPRTQKEAK